MGTSEARDWLVSLGKSHIHGNRACLCAWAVVDVGVELLYTLYKLKKAYALGLFQHICDVVPLLLSRIIWEHGEKVEHHAIVKRLM